MSRKPSFTLRLTKTQVDDLVVVCALGSNTLSKIVSALGDEKIIAPYEVERKIVEQIGASDASALTRIVFALSTVARRRDSTSSDVLDAVSAFLAKSHWNSLKQQQWQDCRSLLQELLSTPSVILAAKTSDLSNDFERVWLNARILTDLRPVFDETQNIIVGSIITQTLRMEYGSPNGDTGSIEVVLDADDIKQLLKSCKAALEKAQVAKDTFKTSMQIVVPGERRE